MPTYEYSLGRLAKWNEKKEEARKKKIPYVGTDDLYDEEIEDKNPSIDRM